MLQKSLCSLLADCDFYNGFQDGTDKLYSHITNCLHSSHDFLHCSYVETKGFMYTVLLNTKIQHSTKPLKLAASCMQFSVEFIKNQCCENSGYRGHFGLSP